MAQQIAAQAQALGMDPQTYMQQGTAHMVCAAHPHTTTTLPFGIVMHPNHHVHRCSRPSMLDCTWYTRDTTMLLLLLIQSDVLLLLCSWHDGSQLCSHVRFL